jgi:hypothetical protein
LITGTATEEVKLLATQFKAIAILLFICHGVEFVILIQKNDIENIFIEKASNNLLALFCDMHRSPIFMGQM